MFVLKKSLVLSSLILFSFPSHSSEVYKNRCAPSNTTEILHFIDQGQCVDAVPQKPSQYIAKGIAKPPQVYVKKGIQIAKDRAVVLFDYNSSALKPDEQPILAAWGQALQQRPELNLSLEGHTDVLGSRAYNQNLSQQRGLAVLTFFQDYYQVSAQRFQVRGMGEDSPLYQGCLQANDEACRKNRRVEFVLH